MALVELILSGADVFLLKDENVHGKGNGYGAGYGNGYGIGAGYGWGDGSFEAREEYGWTWSN